MFEHALKAQDHVARRADPLCDQDRFGFARLSASKRWRTTVVAVTFVAGVAAGVFLYTRLAKGPESDQSPAKSVTPTLYCEFYNFTHNAVVVSFNFTVARNGNPNLAFTQLFVVEPDGTKTDYKEDQPRWAVGTDDGTPILTSPDAATRIVLYGLKPGAAGVFWTEAGIRSNTYRNLEGKCRQAHLDLLKE